MTDGRGQVAAGRSNVTSIARKQGTRDTASMANLRNVAGHVDCPPAEDANSVTGCLYQTRQVCRLFDVVSVQPCPLPPPWLIGKIEFGLHRSL